MTEQEKEQQYKDKIKSLEIRLSEFSGEIEKYRTELFSLKSNYDSIKREKDKLLSIIDNLAKGMAGDTK